SGEAEQVPEREQREDYGERMEANAVADKPRYQYIAFEQLTYAINREHGEKPWPTIPLQQCRKHSEHETKSESHVRNKNQQPGQDADGDRELQPRERQPDDVVHGKHAHD